MTAKISSILTGVATQSVQYLEELAQAIMPTVWEKAKSLGAKVEETAAKNFAVRRENGNCVAFLRGAVKIKAGEKLKPGEKVCILPEAVWPPEVRNVGISHGEVGAGNKATANIVEVKTNGEVLVTKEVEAGEVLFFDGAQYAIN